MLLLRFLWWPFAWLAWIHSQSHHLLWPGWTDSETSVSFFQHLFPWPVESFSRRDLNPKSPIHLHLALTNEPSQVLIQFTTINEGIPVAVYGWKGDGDTEKAIGTSTTLSSNDLCRQTSTSIAPAHYHSVLLSNLQPDTRYHYQVGITVGQGIIWSELVMYFQSPPPLLDESSSSSYSFVVLANQGTMDGKDSVDAISKLLGSHSVHAIHHLGGLSYARGNITAWDEWFRMIQVYASQVPLMIVVGSTEYDYLNGTGDPSGVNTSYTPTWGNYGYDDSGGECGVVVSKRFQMPRGGNGVFWYRQETPLLTTIVLSSEHDLRPSSPQYQWLEAELQRVPKDHWIIVEIHRPLYMNQAQWSDNNVGLGLRRSMEAVLRNKVHLVLSGHYPAYFRSCAGLFQSRCHNGGPTHITLGSAGRVSTGTLLNTTEDTEWYPASWATKTIGNTRGLGRVTVHNRSTLEFQWIGLDQQESSQDGNILDHVWITK